MIEFEFTATAGQRLDKLVVAHLDGFTRNQVQGLIEQGHVTVDGASAKPGNKMRGGETIHITLPADESSDDIDDPAGEDIPLSIVYEDDAIVVVNKPAGMVVHPAVGNEHGTLVNALLNRYPALAETERKGVVHRLDKDTSGLMVVGKTEAAIENLMAQFKARTVDKTYLAMTERPPRSPSGRIDAPIARDPRQRKRMAVVRDGKPAVTEFDIIERDLQGDRAVVRLELHTGRTHQIRVHMAFIGAPVVGDRVYGFRKQRIKLKRHFLHAAELAFDHPTTGERVTFEAPLPVGLQNVLEKVRVK